MRKAVRSCFLEERIRKPAQLTVCFVTDKRIKELNSRYSGKNIPTDVIAFDIGENKNFILADIVVSADTAQRNCRIYKTTPLYELYLYVVHGVLHILGYNDKNARQRKLMEDKANRIICRYIKAKL